MNPAAPPTVDPRLAIALRRHIQAATGRVVALVETHISWVLLTDAMAYKLKKPVHLPFVDFRTLTALQRSADHALDIYTPEATRRTFARLADGARIALQAGFPVIVDAAFLRRAAASLCALWMSGS
ncbi:hypothetical protein [Variovorax humicola]|uniref:hypothetical protein n=1 Tax=Variovorax humicola TaxID=1769758 RepID=UPI003BF47B0E